MKAYDLEYHYQQNLKSPFSDHFKARFVKEKRVFEDFMLRSLKGELLISVCCRGFCLGLLS